MARGRHWLHGDIGPDEQPLACLYFGEPTGGQSCAVRSCECGAQLWVSTAWLPAVEARDLIPVCWWCCEHSGQAGVVIDAPLRTRRREDELERIGGGDDSDELGDP